MINHKILIVDDDKDLLLALKVRLTSQGYGILTATDAATAIHMVTQHRPDLILLDLGLPDSNGFVVMDFIKELTSTASIPVIVVSARPLNVYREPALLAGAKEYFQKPFENDDLIKAIQKELAHP
jgi:two-component system KDP operon response regulator KdpE